MTTRFSQFDPVVLAVDLPDDGLRAGTKGVILDILTVPTLGYEVEFFDDDGNTITFFAVPPEYLRSRDEKREN